MNKTILLDVDGVIVRDRVLLDHVKHNAIQYVSKKLPMSNARCMNTILYKAYGHTAIGLNEVYGFDVSDYNDRVYDSHLIDHLHDFVENSEDFKQDSETIRNFLSMGYDVELFSNAPLAWTEPIKRSIDERIKNGMYCKPAMKTYVKFNPYKDYVFVDDKICNLMPSLFFKNWTPVHFSEHSEFACIPTINSLSSILEFL
jgi:hypothetical protein